MFDGTEDDEPWLPCRAPRWCAHFGDRMSATLINRRLPYVFKEGALGMVLSSSKTKIRCSFFADGGTMTRFCTPMSPKGCEPGCSNIDGGDAWCKDVALESETVYGCAFRPKDFGAMMQHHEMRPGSFNEVVVDPTSWSGDAPDPPDAIEAFFFIRDPEAEAEHAFRIGTGPNPYLVLSSGRRSLARKKARDGEDEARKIYGRFQRRYPHARVPLVRLELDHLERPFTRVA